MHASPRRWRPLLFWLVVILLTSALLAACIKPFKIHWGLEHIAAPAQAGDAAQIRQLIASLPAGEQLSLQYLDRPDSRRLAWLHWQRPESRCTVLFFQGGGSRAAGALDETRQAYATLGADLVIWDYPGQGLSTGPAGIELMRADAHALARLLRQQIGRSRPLIYHGLSVGSLLAGELARDAPPEALVLDGAITTLRELVWGQARQRIPWPARPFVGIAIDDGLDSFDNLAALAHFERPLLILQGQRDSLTPTAFAERLRAQHKQPAGVSLVSVAEAGHAEPLKRPLGRQALQQFLMPLCGPSPLSLTSQPS
jgi:pimeloyl-ACP methyl ester carboxylesterase